MMARMVGTQNNSTVTYSSLSQENDKEVILPQTDELLKMARLRRQND